MTQTIDNNGAVHDRRGRYAEKPSAAAVGAADLVTPEDDERAEVAAALENAEIRVRLSSAIESARRIIDRHPEVHGFTVEDGELVAVSRTDYRVVADGDPELPGWSRELRDEIEGFGPGRTVIAIDDDTKELQSSIVGPDGEPWIMRRKTEASSFSPSGRQVRDGRVGGLRLGYGWHPVGSHAKEEAGLEQARDDFARVAGDPEGPRAQ